MGAYSPAPVVDEAMAARIMTEIVEPTVAGMAAEGRTFRGVLYAGLMIGADGPRLIEYHVSFGDADCQALMLRLKLGRASCRERVWRSVYVAVADGSFKKTNSTQTRT